MANSVEAVHGSSSWRFAIFSLSDSDSARNLPLRHMVSFVSIGVTGGGGSMML